MTFEEAKQLSILKWEYLVEHPKTELWDIPFLIPELKRIIHACGFCHLYFQKTENGYCQKCPLAIGYDTSGNSACSQSHHPFSCFKQAEDEDMLRQYASEVLSMIQKAEEIK